MLEVWGSGPDGALAVHACELAGVDWRWRGAPNPTPLNLSERRLHMSEPTRELLGLTVPATRLVYVDAGAAAASYPCDLLEVYRLLWRRWCHRLEPVESWVRVLQEYASAEPKPRVVAGEPAPNLCRVVNGLSRDACKFELDTVVYTQDQHADVPPQTWVFNSERSPSWSEAGRIFGLRYTEWAAGAAPAFINTEAHQKVAGGSCQCWPEIQRVGNLATWTPGLNHGEAFEHLYTHLRKELRDGKKPAAQARRG